MKSLDEGTLDALADLICGDAEGFPYRKGWELPKFFRRAGLECEDHDGSTRKWWALEKLRLYNCFTDDMGEVILRLANPIEYQGDPVMTKRVIDELNRILAIEGIKIELNGVKPTLLECEPSMPVSKASDAVRPPAPPPDIAAIVNDPGFRELLLGRWHEVQRCADAGAFLAALVLLGSLLEGVLDFVIKAHPKEANKASASPRDPAGVVRPFREWTLSQMIDVAHECGWIQADVKSFSHSLRNYRNIVHPAQQLADGVTPDADTLAICIPVVRAALNDVSSFFGSTGTVVP